MCGTATKGEYSKIGRGLDVGGGSGAGCYGSVKGDMCVTKVFGSSLTNVNLMEGSANASIPRLQIRRFLCQTAL